MSPRRFIKNLVKIRPILDESCCPAGGPPLRPQIFGEHPAGFLGCNIMIRCDCANYKEFLGRIAEWRPFYRGGRQFSTSRNDSKIWFLTTSAPPDTSRPAESIHFASTIHAGHDPGAVARVEHSVGDSAFIFGVQAAPSRSGS